MLSLDYLRRECDGMGPERFGVEISEAVREGHLKPDEFSLRRLAEAVLGYQVVQSLDPRPSHRVFTPLIEAAGATRLSAFSNITGQIFFNKIMEGYQQPMFIGSRLVEVIPTTLENEKIPSMQSIPDDNETVNEGEPYPYTQFGERYVTTPDTLKKGQIVALTREAIFFDRTGLVNRHAFKVGEMLGLNKEKRILKEIMGLNGNSYTENGTAKATYQTTDWTNDHSNELLDWNDVNSSFQLLSEMTDPDTGESIMVEGRQMLVMPNKRFTAMRVVNATETRSGDITAGDGNQVVAPNPLAGMNMQVFDSAIARKLLVDSGVSAGDADKYWFHGDFMKAFAYMENWPITVTQAPQNSYDEFKSDIVQQVKASERGVPATLEPRTVIRNKN